MTEPSGSDSTGTRTAKCHACGTTGRASAKTCAACGTPYSKRHAPGTILGSYRLHDVIGEGGMGIVYLATHTRLGRRVAIKMLRSHYTNNEQAVHRFFAEARAVNQIQHPNIVEITDFIEQPGGDNYYVMELLQGSSLAQQIDSTGTGILPLERAIGILMQVSSVLEAVHQAGIVHRDIKPDNVFLIERAGQKDFVKLVDFGVAKLMNESDTAIATHNTNPGAVLGTPDYMSPEQASAKAVDHRTDIYAFGVLMYRLVTGQLPLMGDDFGELVVQLLTVEPTPPSQVPGLPHEVPPALEALIMQCLAKSTTDRPDRMESVSEALAEIAEDQGWIVYELNLNTSGPIRLPSGSIPPLNESTRRTGPVPAVNDPTRSSGAMPAVREPIRRSSGQIPPLPRAATQPPVEAQAPAPQPEEAGKPSSRTGGDQVVWPAPERKPSRPLWPILVAGGAALVVCLIVIGVLVMRGSSHGGDSVKAKVQAQLHIADDRIANGRLVAADGDDALAHLVAARKLDPNNAAVRERLGTIARTYEKLAQQAIDADSLPEAAAHLQVVLTAEPDNATAAKAMKDVEAKMLSRQHARP